MIDDLKSSWQSRRTFAIISHPDAGKTTLTEKILLFAGAIQLAGTIKARKSSRAARSDWMAMEQQRGISVSSSVMQFDYEGKVFNLLDTPGHEDFSEDTYRTLTAVDGALMVLDGAKGVESRTIKLMEVCQLRQTPIITFINKLDRESKDFFELLDDIEKTLHIKAIPMVWPLGSGRDFWGLVDLKNKITHLYPAQSKLTKNKSQTLSFAQSEVLAEQNFDFQRVWLQAKEQIDLISELIDELDLDEFKKGKASPVYFGSAVNNFGLEILLKGVAELSPPPLKRQAIAQSQQTKDALKKEVMIEPSDERFSGFVFKVQANMDPKHRDRLAFLRVVSGSLMKGQKVCLARTGKSVRIHDPLTFLANARKQQEVSYAGDIVGVVSHGDWQIGDTFTAGENWQFIGIPHFAPELFKRVILKDPLQAKALHKGLKQLSEEGAVQIFQPHMHQQPILGAVGLLQFDVVQERLMSEYQVRCIFETESIYALRWLRFSSKLSQKQFVAQYERYLAYDYREKLVYLSPNPSNLDLAQSKNPEVSFLTTQEIQS